MSSWFLTTYFFLLAQPVLPVAFVYNKIRLACISTFSREPNCSIRKFVFSQRSSPHQSRIHAKNCFAPGSSKKKIPLLFIRIPCLPLQVLPRCSILHQPEISSLRDEHHLLNDMKKSLINHKDKAKKMLKECLKIIIFLNNLSD